MAATARSMIGATRYETTKNLIANLLAENEALKQQVMCLKKQLVYSKQSLIDDSYFKRYDIQVDDFLLNIIQYTNYTMKELYDAYLQWYQQYNNGRTLILYYDFSYHISCRGLYDDMVDVVTCDRLKKYKTDNVFVEDIKIVHSFICNYIAVSPDDTIEQTVFSKAFKLYSGHFHKRSRKGGYYNSAYSSYYNLINRKLKECRYGAGLVDEKYIGIKLLQDKLDADVAAITVSE